MPTIFFYGPRLEKEKKKELIRSFTEAAAAATGINPAAFVVYLQEVEAGQVGVGGELLEERQKRG